MGFRQNAALWFEEIVEGPYLTFVRVQIVGVAALLAAVDNVGVQVCVTLAVPHLVAVVLVGKLVEGGLDDAAHRRTKYRVGSF